MGQINRKTMSVYGTLDKSYHLGRKTRRSLLYRLNRRTREVIRSIKHYYVGTAEDIIDLGTADALMLAMIKDTFPSVQCMGVEYSQELVEANSDTRVIVVRGDVNYLPVPSDSFDIAIATAIIEHLPHPRGMLEEAKRVLRQDGLLILTSPHPFWERVARMVGHLAEDRHCKLMTLKELVSLFGEIGYEVLEQKKFMLSPIGMPLETLVEGVVRSCGLSFLFANQLVIARNKKI